MMRPTSTEQTLNAWTLETGRKTRPFNFNNVKIILIVGSISDVKIDKPESGSFCLARYIAYYINLSEFMDKVTFCKRPGRQIL